MITKDIGLTSKAEELITKRAWEWFRENEHRVLFEKGVWFLKLRVTIGMFEDLMEELFGPEPV